ncbi:hypothetical protein [Microbacterium sp. NFH-22A-Y]|uniref:hypothetical protein n=1 Tax=Microbacterium sp. NFH-22A-Y TaxID=2744448 RepID=UPI001F4255E4|nr:hypothetical protein [Microbacterium sp. NFH-22A-Y]
MLRSLLWQRVFTAHTTAGQRAFSILLLLLGVAFVWIGVKYGPLVFAAAAASIAAVLILLSLLLRARSGQSHRLTYVLEDGTSTMTIHATSEYWTITDHNRAPRAKGAGERLQKLLLTSAAAAADSVDVGIRLTASAPVLAAEYAERLPGLMEVGPAFPYGIAMYRPSLSQRKKLVASDRVES